MAKSADEVIKDSVPEEKPFGGQTTATTTGAAIGTRPCKMGVYITNEDAAIAILVGGLTADCLHKIKAGDCRWIPCSSLANIFVKSASATAVFSYLAI